MDGSIGSALTDADSDYTIDPVAIRGRGLKLNKALMRKL